MTERVLIPVPGLGMLSLTADQLREALAAGAELIPSPTPSGSRNAEPLLDSDAAALRLGVTPRWLEDVTRAGVCPHHKFGRFVRYDVSEVSRHFRVEGATPTDSHFVAPLRRVTGQ